MGIEQIFCSYNNPKGNAETERVIRTIKEELLWLNEFTSFEESRDSLTNLLWQKHMRLWTPRSGNLAIDMSEEKRKDLAEKINKIFKSYKKS
jgi:hypothetical protein